MGVLSGLERRLQGAVDKTFARIFGGAVQPAEVTAALQHEAAAHLARHDSRVIARNRYIVELGPSDSAEVGADIRRVNAAFSAMLGTHLRDRGWDTFAAVAVTFEESPRLHTGQFRVRSLVDPSVGDMYDVPAIPTPPATPHPSRPAAASPHPRPRPRPRPPMMTPPAQGQGGSPGQQGAAPWAPSYLATPTSHPAAGYPTPAPPPEPAPRLIVQDGTGRSHPLRRGSNIVGRGQGAAVRLADTSVSRQHIDVYFDGRVAIVHDLGSTNGTTVNGSPVQTWQLADGDVIAVGQSTLVFVGR